MPRKQLPISQRHAGDCTRPSDCACPWSARVRLHDGTQRRITGSSYAEAEQAYYELMARRPEPLADKTTTVGQWAQRWLKLARSPDGKPWRPSTATMYRYWCDNHIAGDPIAAIKVTEVRRDDVRLWLERMQDSGTGPSARRNALTLVHAMYQTWIRDGRLLPYGNPAVLMLAPRPARKDFVPLTREQVTAWAAAMPAGMGLIVEMEAFYGCRQSEVLALREEDVQFAGRDVNAPLVPQLARLAELDPAQYADRRPVIQFQRKLEVDRSAGPIKNLRGNRRVPLPQWLAAELSVQFAARPPADGWLFTQSRSLNTRPEFRRWTGRPVPYFKKTYYDCLRVAAGKAGVVLPKGQCSHALRHHCVSVLRSQGLSDQDIAHWIGDSVITVTTVYGRPMPDAMDRVAERLSEHRDQPRRLRAV